MRILLTHTPGARARYYGEEALAALRGLGDVVLHDGDTPLDTLALTALARGCEIVVCDRQTPGTAAFFAASPDLIAFLRCAMDVRNIDIAAASAAGVLVTRASAGFVDAVAELGIGLLVDLARGIGSASAAYRAGRVPEVKMGVQLSGTTLGIVGCGAIGRRLGMLAATLGMTVLASDPDPDAIPGGIVRMEFGDLLARSRFVVCLAPAGEATRHLFDAPAFASMMPGSYFVNLARGELVDEDALAAALDSGRLAGAAIDVGSAPDQMPPSRLAARTDVVATPHIGGLTPQAVAHQAFDTVRQVAALARGELPENAINAADAERVGRLVVRIRTGAAAR